MAKTPDEITDELIEKNFQQSDYSCMLPREKEAVRKCIKQALAIGGMLELIRDSNVNLALIEEISKDAENFEKTLDASTDTTRVPSAVMPWGWDYQDKELQKKFRDFCVSLKKQ